jgi:hypothetical protein
VFEVRFEIRAVAEILVVLIKSCIHRRADIVGRQKIRRIKLCAISTGFWIPQSHHEMLFRGFATRVHFNVDFLNHPAEFR